MGEWTYTDGDDINDRPIYRKTGNNYVMAVATVPSGYKPNWVVGSTPGGQSGFIFEKYFKSPKCPHAVSAWTYFSQNTGNTEDDASLTVTCAADCAGSTIPAAPRWSMTAAPRRAA